jgi:thioredoxin 1
MVVTISRRIALATALSLTATPLLSQIVNGPGVKFSKAAFDKAQLENKSILVEITAPWCPVCKVQKPILSTLKDSGAYKDVIIFEIDFDSQKDLLQEFRVIKQSTLIAFKGKVETARLVGETKPEVIETLFKTMI